jgi:tRNA (adenine57-N1/adenine58-N1)-methyltransferase
VRSFLGEESLSRYDVALGDSYEEVPAGEFDRVMLDLPEPWRVVPHAEKILTPGGLLVAYTPSITQAVQVREALGKGWVDQRTLEVLHRTWHIEGMAVRPDHRMVAHTAFLTVARFTAV